MTPVNFNYTCSANYHLFLQRNEVRGKMSLMAIIEGMHLHYTMSHDIRPTQKQNQNKCS